jgi:hypothetical protein
MSTHGIVVGWNGARSGKEKGMPEKFGEFVGYLLNLQMSKMIDSFEPVILSPHGGDLNGFFLIRADRGRIGTLRGTDAWKDWEMWGLVNMEGFGVNEAFLGDEIADVMKRYAKAVAK